MSSNAHDLIDAYWANVKKKSVDKKSASARKPAESKSRQASAKRTAKSMEKEDSNASAKRGKGRASATGRKRNSASDDSGSEEDAPEEPKSKKRKAETTHVNGANKRSFAVLDQEPDEDGDVVMVNDKDNKTILTMKDLKMDTAKSWEKFIKHVSTVEQVDGQLMVYFETYVQCLLAAFPI